MNILEIKNLLGAISFVKKGETTREKVQKIVRDFQLLPIVKNELEKRREELEYKS